MNLLLESTYKDDFRCVSNKLLSRVIEIIRLSLYKKSTMKEITCDGMLTCTKTVTYLCSYKTIIKQWCAVSKFYLRWFLSVRKFLLYVSLI